MFLPVAQASRSISPDMSLPGTKFKILLQEVRDLGYKGK